MDILRRIDVALLRMEQAGHKDTARYRSLKTKRDRVASGDDYTVVDVIEETIRAVGGLLAIISRTNRMTKLDMDDFEWNIKGLRHNA